jgi:hypothetical protein
VIGREALEMIRDIVSILGKTELKILLNQFNITDLCFPLIKLLISEISSHTDKPHNYISSPIYQTIIDNFKVRERELYKTFLIPFVFEGELINNMECHLDSLYNQT